MSLRRPFGLNSRKVRFKGRPAHSGGTPFALFLYGGPSPLLPSQHIPSYANEPATTLKLFRTLLPIGAFVADVANSERPFNPPSPGRVQMHYLGRLASNGPIFCTHSKAKLYIFSVPPPPFLLPFEGIAANEKCILMHTGETSTVYTPFWWSRPKVLATPFKLVFYCRASFPFRATLLFHHPFHRRPSFSLSLSLSLSRRRR